MKLVKDSVRLWHQGDGRLHSSCTSVYGDVKSTEAVTSDGRHDNVTSSSAGTRRQQSAGEQYRSLARILQLVHQMTVNQYHHYHYYYYYYYWQ